MTDERIALEALIRGREAILRETESGEEVGGDSLRAYGICNLLDKMLWPYDKEETDRIKRNVLEPLFVQWPEYSGVCAYPVPAPTSSPYGAARYYDHLQWGDGNMWGGEYGRARRRLLDWMIEQLEERLG